MPIIIRQYDSKTWPLRAEPISEEEAQKLVKAGKIEKGADGIYQTRVMTAEKITKEAKPEAPAEEQAEKKPAKRKDTRKKAPAKAKR